MKVHMVSKNKSAGATLDFYIYSHRVFFAPPVAYRGSGIFCHILPLTLAICASQIAVLSYFRCAGGQKTAYSPTRCPNYYRDASLVAHQENWVQQSNFAGKTLTSTLTPTLSRLRERECLSISVQYSALIVYNNFPWPNAPSEAHRQRIEEAAQSVLDARAAFPGTSLATLYNPETMPPALVRAHAALDRAVDAAYAPDGGAKTYANDAERVAFLFRRYAEITSLV